jgi:Arc/MetJ-type ribon-helix-helix transcriptional regulator
MAVSKKPRRLHAVLPSSLLLEIDERVGKGRRSEFIREAIAEKLEYRRMNSSELATGVRVEKGLQSRETRESAME